MDIKLGNQAGAKCEQNNLAWYTKNCEERLMMRVPQMKILNCDDSKKKKEYKKEKQNESKNRWKNRLQIKIRPRNG